MKINKFLLALIIAASLSSVTTIANAYCRWVPGYWHHGYFHPGYRVCRHGDWDRGDRWRWRHHHRYYY